MDFIMQLWSIVVNFASSLLWLG